MFAHAVSLPRPPFRETQLPSASQRWGPRFGPLSLAGHLPAGLQGAQRNGCGQCVAPGRSLLDPWAGRSSTLARPLGLPGAFCSLTLGLAGMRQPRTRLPAGCRAALLGLLFPWAPPQQGKQGASCGRLASKVDRRRRGERFFGELTLSRCQSSRREELQLTSSSSCDETCLCRRQVLRARPSTRVARPQATLLAMTSCKPNRVA